MFYRPWQVEVQVALETHMPAPPRDHVVQFYEEHGELIETVSSFLADALSAGDVAIIVASSAHRDAFEIAMASNGIDVGAAYETGVLIGLDAEDALSRFTTDDGVDPDAFDALLGGVVREASGSGRRVRAYGEMVALLWDRDDVASAITVESLWNDLGLRVPFSLFCAYPAKSMTGAHKTGAFAEVCHQHSAIVGRGSSRPRNIDGLAEVEETRSFRHGLDAPRAARTFVTEALERWGHGELVDDAALVVTELATNAVVHAEADFMVVLSSPGGAVRISVRDSSSAPPVLREVSTAVTGRGIALVAALATTWGTAPTTDGKVVWAEFR